MPRRERRKCSFCAKTGHNKRTCSTYKKSIENTVESVETDEINDSNIVTIEATSEAVVSTPPKKKKGGPLPVFVHAQTEHDASPHVVNLKDSSRTALLSSVAVFREAYNTSVTRDTVDFAAMVKRTKRPQKAKRNNSFAFSVSKRKSKVTKVSQKKAFTVASKSQKTRKNTFKISLPTFRLPSIPRLPRLEFRPVMGLVLVLAIITAIPFPAFGYIQEVQLDSARVVAASTDGFVALKDSTLAAFTADIGEAEQQLTRALESFSTATGIIEGQHKVLKSFVSALPVIGSQISGREQLLIAGHHIALGNTYLVKGVSAAQAEDVTLLTDRLNILESHLKSSLVQYNAAKIALSGISDNAIPKEYRAASSDFRSLFATFVDDMEDVTEFINTFTLVLGEDGYKRYLVMFQNNQELRPTGGFMGSYAVLDVQKGNITWDIPGGGTYDVQGQMNLDYEPPLPLQLTNSKWEFQDANWWSHVPASAAIIEEMYENSRHATVDGVFFVNASVLESVLAIVGPIGHVAFDEESTNETILADLQVAKQTYNTEDNKPKAVLGEIVPMLLANIEEKGGSSLLSLLIAAEQALDTKSIQVYMHDEKTQETFRSYGWTGELLATETDQDYLHIVRTNLQGQKSDARIQESISLDTEVLGNGEVINVLQITRTHTGEVGEKYYGATNIAYLRAYVPEGSELISATGFEFPPEEAFHVPSTYSTKHPIVEQISEDKTIDRKSGTTISKEFDKTVFGNWMIVYPGTSETVTLTYRLPNKLKPKTVDDPRAGLPYSFVHQKQSGTASEFSHIIRFPEVWDIAWISEDQFTIGGNFASFSQTLNSDSYYGMVLKTIQ